MFVYSVRASTVKFFSVIALTLVALTLVLVFGGGDELSVSAMSESVDFSGIKTNEDRVDFISECGVEVLPEPKETVSFRVPENFDRVVSGYNEIQKQQGLNIDKYKNKKVTRDTYEAKSYEDFEGPVFVNLIVYKNTVIACDVSSANPDGFVHPLVKLS